MRWARHLFARSSTHRFPEAALERIARAIAASEARHTGEVCFAVEGALPLSAVLAGQRARGRADEVFARLRVWDTEANNGVLVYLLLADQAIEIVADRGLATRVGEAEWTAVCEALAARLREGEYEAGVMQAIAEVSVLLERHFPRGPGDVEHNELPDRPHRL